MEQQNAVPNSNNHLSNSHVVQLPIDIHAWLTHMESKVERASLYCIPRVPPILRDRESNKKLFDPLMVSLGPYHYGESHLQRMEKYKFDALKRFTNGDLQGKAASFYKELEPSLLEAKEWYEKPISLCDEEFKKMMFMDSCFILDFIHECLAKQKPSKEPRKQIPRVTTNISSTHPLNSHEEVLVLRDMMMLENQIPFFLLDKLKNIKPDSNESLIFFTSFANEVLHLPKAKPNSSAETPIHLLDLFRTRILGPENKQAQHLPETSFRESVTELKEAGIICKKGDGSCLREVSFKKSFLHRVLILPHLVIDDVRKYLFPNMIAYETAPGGPPDYGIVSYICLMDALINKEEDVKELKANDVIDNALGTDKEVADFFNGLGTDLISDSEAYADVKGHIERHYKSPWVKFRVHLLELRRTYFNSPWSTIGLFAGVLLLFLAAIQTYFTVYSPPDK